MAPFRSFRNPAGSTASSNKDPARTSILHGVKSGRIGEDSKKVPHIKNKGKELFPMKVNARSAPQENDNTGKELFPNLSSLASFLPSTTPEDAASSVNPEVKAPSTSASSKRTRKHRDSRKLTGALIRQELSIRFTRHGIANRNKALQADSSHVVVDARNAKTTPYAAANLDLITRPLESRHKKLNLSIAVGLLGHAPVFTPAKTFSLNAKGFSNTDSLAKLVLGSKSVQSAATDVGINLADMTLAGYEMKFPQGYRYVKGEGFDTLSGRAVTFKVVSGEKYALINTSCAFNEFYWQAEHYGSDEDGNVEIGVVARLGVKVYEPSGEIGCHEIDSSWRTKEEKRLLRGEK